MKNTVESIIQNVLETTPTSGLAIVAGNLNQLFCEEYAGTIHPSSNEPITKDTLFDTQSITKVLAPASILIELTNTNISLDMKVINLVPELKGKNKDLITLRHLLLHQAGYSDEDFTETYAEPAQLWNAMFTKELRFVPGESLEYTDVGYRILGLALERICKENLDTLASKFVWKPLDMTSTTYNLANINKNKIAGQGESWGSVDDAQDRFLNQPLGCDGVFSSSQDLVKFCRFWLQRFSDKNFNKYFLEVSAGKLNQEWSHYESLGLGKKVFGWEVHSKQQSYLGEMVTIQTIEKAGGAGAFICIRPDKKDFFIYLTNHGRPDPFTAEAWNSLISKLQVTKIVRKILK